MVDLISHFTPARNHFFFSRKKRRKTWHPLHIPHTCLERAYVLPLGAHFDTRPGWWNPLHIFAECGPKLAMCIFVRTRIVPTVFPSLRVNWILFTNELPWIASKSGIRIHALEQYEHYHKPALAIKHSPSSLHLHFHFYSFSFSFLPSNEILCTLRKMRGSFAISSISSCVFAEIQYADTNDRLPHSQVATGIVWFKNVLFVGVLFAFSAHFPFSLVSGCWCWCNINCHSWLFILWRKINERRRRRGKKPVKTTSTHCFVFRSHLYNKCMSVCAVCMGCDIRNRHAMLCSVHSIVRCRLALKRINFAQVDGQQCKTMETLAHAKHLHSIFSLLFAESTLCAAGAASAAAGFAFAKEFPNNYGCCIFI